MKQAGTETKSRTDEMKEDYHKYEEIKDKYYRCPEEVN